MAYGISLSEQQQQEESHPIYTALRAIIEQGTTALLKLIQVNICTNPFGIPLQLLWEQGYIRRHRSTPPSSPFFTFHIHIRSTNMDQDSYLLWELNSHTVKEYHPRTHG